MQKLCKRMEKTSTTEYELTNLGKSGECENREIRNLLRIESRKPTSVGLVR